MSASRPAQTALKDASLHLGIVGALGFAVFILIFRQDWADKYSYLSYLLPVPVIALLIARRFSLLGGLLLVALGIGAAVFDVFYTPGHPGQITGRGLGYSIVFVSLPLVLSGMAAWLAWWKNRPAP